jgi:hypothetical protein
MLQAGEGFIVTVVLQLLSQLSFSTVTLIVAVPAAPASQVIAVVF